MDRLTKKRILDIGNYELLSICEFYLLSKMTKSLFKRIGKRAIDILSLVHSDVCGSMSINARGGYNYFITFTDILSRYGYVYLMKHKSKSFEVFKRLCNVVKK